MTVRKKSLGTKDLSKNSLRNQQGPQRELKERSRSSGTRCSLGKQKRRQVATLLSGHRKRRVFVAWSVVQECKKRGELATEELKCSLI